MSETSPGNTKKPKFSRARQLAKLVLAGPENKIHDNLLSGATYDEASAEIGKLRDVFRADQGPVGTIARKLDSLTAIRQQNLPEGVQMKPVTEFHTGGKALAIKGHVQVLTSALAPNVKYGAILLKDDEIGADPLKVTGTKITSITIGEDASYDTETGSGTSALSVNFKSRPVREINDPIGSAREWETNLKITPGADGNFNYGLEYQSRGYNRPWSGWIPLEEITPEQLKNLASTVDSIQPADQAIPQTP